MLGVLVALAEEPVLTLPLGVVEVGVLVAVLGELCGGGVYALLLGAETGGVVPGVGCGAGGAGGAGVFEVLPVRLGVALGLAERVRVAVLLGEADPDALAEADAEALSLPPALAEAESVADPLADADGLSPAL